MTKRLTISNMKPNKTCVNAMDDGVEVILDETIPCIDEPTFIDHPYTDSDWGMYKFIGLKTNVVHRLYELNNKWRGEVILNLFADLDRHENSDDLYDIDSLYLYIYYHKNNKELLCEIEHDKIISEHWSDSDTYTFDEKTITKLKEKEIFARYWLNMFEGHARMFNHEFYDKEN